MHQHSQRGAFGKDPPHESTGGQTCLLRPGRTGRGPVQSIHLFHLRDTHWTREIQLDSRHQTGHRILTGQEQYISAVGSSQVRVTVQQHQPLLHLSLSTSGGVTARTAAVVRRHEGNKPDDEWPVIRSTRRTAPSALSLVRSRRTKNWPRS